MNNQTIFVLSMQLFLTAPNYWLFFIFLASILLGYFTYFGFKRPSKEVFAWPNSLLCLLRVCGIFFLLLLLLSPFVKFKKREILKPKVALLIDNSLSINNTKGVDLEINAFRDNIVKELRDFDITVYDLEGVNNQDSIQFNLTNTDLTKGIKHIAAENNEQLQALVVLSDGIVNEGANPSYYPFPLKVPIYAIGLGDTTAVKDIKVADAKTNEFVVLGNNYPLVFNIIADQCMGQTIQYNIFLNGSNVHAGSVIVNDGHFFFSKQVMLTAKVPGVQKIKIQTTTLATEKNKTNNEFEVFLNVLDNRKKIAIYYQGVHPDIKAMNLALSVQKNYEVKVTNNLSDALAADAIVAVQVPNINGNKSDAMSILSAKKPILLLGGEQLDWSAWNGAIGSVLVRSNKPNNAQFQINELFSGFTTEKEDVLILNTLPPLVVPFGSYPNQLKSMAYQKINGITTDYPLIAVSESPNRIAVLMGEGFWKWRQHNFLRVGNYLAIDNLADHLMQWLLSGKDKPLFSVNAAKSVFDKMDEVVLRAELYNQIFESLPNEKVVATISSDSFKKEVILSYNGSQYEINLGNLPSGDYKVAAKAKGLLAQTGFTISQTSKEERIIQADWNLLRTLSENNQGNFYSSKDAALLINELKSKLNKTAVIKMQEDLKDFINIAWVLALIAFLFTAEWILRKYYGKL